MPAVAAPVNARTHATNAARRRDEQARKSAEKRRQQLARHIESGGKLWKPAHRNGLTFVDIFCGAGGSSIGLSNAGYTLLLAANHWQTAIDTHGANFPGSEHLCFPAEVLVTTATGQRPIAEIEVGELVLTHRGRWRPVLRKFTKRDKTVVMRSYLHSAGIEATPNHEFYMRRTVLGPGQPAYVRQYGEPEWVPVGDALTDQTYRQGHERHAVALPSSFGQLDWEDPPAELGDPLSAWWLVGRWLGDGHVHHRNKSVAISCGRHEISDLRSRLPEGWCTSDTHTAIAFYRYSSKLYQWLTERFGFGAAGKNLPGWVLSMPEDRRRAVLDGYVSADGSERDGSIRADSVSKALALGIRMLAHSLGFKAGVHYSDRGDRCVIEGREVNRKPIWTVKWVTTPRRVNTLTDDLHCWALVKSVTPSREDVDVYTMEVAEDHSYVADGLVVKNCADVNNYDFRYLPRGADVLWASPICTELSPAGGNTRVKRDANGVPDLDMVQELGHVSQKGQVRTRATFYDVLRATEVHRFKVVIVENVPDAVDWELFDVFLFGMNRLRYDYQLVSVNSAHIGGEGIPYAPQWRDRLYIVFTRKDVGRKPDVTPAPVSWCNSCATDVKGVQTWAPSMARKRFKVGRYRRRAGTSYGQYWYTCPNTGCRLRVEPYVLPAITAIDLDDVGVRIGDLPRTAKKPEGLAPNTMRRVRTGLRTLGRPSSFYVKNYAGFADPARMVKEVTANPFGTMTTGRNHSLINTSANSNHLMVPPMLVPSGGTWAEEPLDALNEPARTVLANEKGCESLVTPAPFLAMLRRNGGTVPLTQPMPTLTAAGTHHALIVPYYTNGDTSTTGDPFGTVSTRDRYAMVGAGQLAEMAELDAMDAFYRMIKPRESLRAQTFPDDYIVLGGAGEQTMQAGNAVSCNAAQWLGQAVAAVLLARPA